MILALTPAVRQLAAELVDIFQACRCRDIPPQVDCPLLTPPQVAALMWIWTQACTFDHQCDAADAYIDYYNITNDHDLCLVYKMFGCPHDCNDNGGGPIIDDPVYPPRDPTLPWAIDQIPNGWGDPFKEPPRVGNVEFARGTFTTTEIDLSLPSPGFSWVIAAPILVIDRIKPPVIIRWLKTMFRDTTGSSSPSRP